MEMHVAQHPASHVRQHPSAPPPPLRRKLHVPTEPVVFAALLMALVMFIAKAGPFENTEAAATEAPATVAQTSR